MQLRDYQKSAIEQIQIKFKEGLRKIILVLIMSGGKTIIASRMIQMTVNNGKHVLFLAHRKELIEQAHDKLKQFSGIDAGIIKSGIKPDRTKKVQVASIQTLVRRELPKASLVIVDECHNSLSKSYLQVLKQYEENGAAIVGLTATPYRTSRAEWLGMFYQDYVYPVRPADLIDLKYLVPTKVYAAEKIVAAHFKKTKGDYDEEELMRVFDKDDVYKSLINNIILHAHNKQLIVFCCNVQHSKKVADVLNANGISARHVDGNCSDAERTRAIQDFKDNKFLCLVNVALYTEGTDLPCASGVCFVTATASRIKYYQCGGRAMRPYTYPDGSKKEHAIILDLADNTIRHGFLESDIEIDIHNENASKKGVPPTRECPQCNRILLARVTVCPECGYVFPIVKKEKEKPEDTLLVELDKNMVAVEKYRFYPKEKWDEVPTELLGAFAKMKGFHTGWVKHELARRNEGRKIVKILDYTDKDKGGYWKMKNWLEKAYYDKTIRIPAETWQFEKEDGSYIYFRYLPGKVEKEENLLF